jgi:hypothetical protein
MSERSLSPPREAKTCRLGILGTRQDLASAETTQLLDLIKEDSGDFQALYVPHEGYSSIYAEAYADANEIPCTAFEAEWYKHGRSAKARRDAEIVRHATHFLIFGGPRSQQPLSVARSLLRKGHAVYYLPHGSLELEALEPEVASFQATRISVEKDQATLDHTLSKGRGRSQVQSQVKSPS